MSYEIVNRLQEFLDKEARPCSIDFGCVTPKYVFRMWGGTVMGMAGTFSRVVGVNQTKSNVLTERIDVRRREGRKV